MSRSYSARRSASRAKTVSTIRGASSFRRLLRRVPDATRSRLVDFLTITGAKLADIMGGRIGMSRRKRQHLRLAITDRVLAASLSLKIGLPTKALQKNFFYGHILDVGRKAQTVTAYRRRNGVKVSSYAMNVGAIAPMHLREKSLEDFRDVALPDYRKLLGKVLLEVGAGNGDD